MSASPLFAARAVSSSRYLRFRRWWLLVLVLVVVGAVLVVADSGHADPPASLCGDLTGDTAGPGGGPANDDFSDAEGLEGRSGTVEGTLVDATVQNSSSPVEVDSEDPSAFESGYSGVNATRSVWYCWMAPADGVYRFDTQGSGSPYDGATRADAPALTIVDLAGEPDWSDGAGTFLWGGFGTDAGGGGDSSPYYSLQGPWVAEGATLMIRVSNGLNGWNGEIPDEGDFTLNWSNPPSVGAAGPSIGTDGEPAVFAVGDTVTADPGEWNGEPTITFDYQWQRCDADGSNCDDLSGETSLSYETVSADLEHTLMLRVTASNDGGIEIAGTDLAYVLGLTGAPSLFEDAGSPYIWGSAEVGQTIGVTRGVWAGARPVTYDVQWRRCDTSGDSCSDISGATDQTYEPVSADIGSTLRAVVTATNGSGSDSATSDPSSPVPTLTPYVISPPWLDHSGAGIGVTIVGSDGYWGGLAPITFAYQWQRCESDGSDCVDISGETSASYTTVEADDGHAVKLIVTATNSAGSLPAETDLVAVALEAPTVTSDPFIEGGSPPVVVETGETVVADPGEWSGTSISHDYQWDRCDIYGSDCTDISGATGLSYETVSADAAQTLRLEVTATNSGGSGSAFTGFAVVTADEGAPVSFYIDGARPHLSGVAEIGETLTLTDGIWSGAQPITFDRQWLRCPPYGGGCETIPASGSSYTLTSADEGWYIWVVVVGTNTNGNSSGYSNNSDVVAGTGSPVNQVLPTAAGVSGAQEGETVYAQPGVWGGAQPMTGFAYQWRICDVNGSSCSEISGATGDTYTPASGDVNHRLRVVVTATNSAGSSNATSEATDTISNTSGGGAVPIDLYEHPSISGVGEIDENLYGNPGAWTHSPTSYTYQWRRCDLSGTSCSDISGATSQSYTVVSADVETTLRFAVTATNATGSMTAATAPLPVGSFRATPSCPR